MLFLNHESTETTCPWVFDSIIKLNILKLYKPGQTTHFIYGALFPAKLINSYNFLKLQFPNTLECKSFLDTITLVAKATLESVTRQPKHMHECVDNLFKHFNLFCQEKPNSVDNCSQVVCMSKFSILL